MRPRPRAFLVRLRAEIAAWLVLGGALFATLAAWGYVKGQAGAHERVRFDQLATTALDALRSRVEAYLATLRATRGLFAVGGEPSRRQFAEFVHSMELDRWYPGIQGIGYVKVLSPDEVPRHERVVRAEGFPTYRVWPGGPRDVYTSIVYLEPFDWRNQRAFGYDMASEPARREAMERARDTGTAACTARVELVQEAGAERQPGFLIYLPLYRGDPTELEDRRALLRGYVYAPFRAGDLVDATIGADALSQLGMEVYDADAPSADALLFQSQPPSATPQMEVSRVDRVEVAGRRWTVRYSAPMGFATPWERALPRLVVVIGLLGGILLFGITRAEVRSRAEAQRSAASASLLADVGKLLAESLDYRSTVADVARRASQDQADACVVDLFEPEGLLRIVGHRDAGAGQEVATVLRAASVEARPASRSDGLALPPEPSLARRVDDVALRRLAGGDERVAALRTAGVASVVSVPLLARGEMLGTVTLVSCDPTRSFDEADLAVAKDLGRLVGSAVDTARSYGRAQAAVHQRDEFLSIASHELKTPLTSLALQSHSLTVSAARGQIPAEVGRKADVIRRNVERLTRLIGTLLDISRIGAGRLELELEDVDLAEVVREVAGRFEEELAKAGCTLHLELHGPAVGHWDRLRLDQVVTNLVSNAVKYGQGHPITITLTQAPERVAVAVRDEGIGIPREAQERIFEQFERAVSERHYGGFGLGLWIVRRIVESMGGEVRLESEPGRGATFTVDLARRGATARPAAPPAAEGRRAPPAQGSS